MLWTLNLNLQVDSVSLLILPMFVETSLSFVQVESIKKISEYVAQLRRVGKGHGMYIATITALDVSFH